MITASSDCRHKQRTLMRVALRHEMTPEASQDSRHWIRLGEGQGRTLVARNGQRYGRPTMFLSKLSWQFDLENGLMIGAVSPSKSVGPDTVPVTFAGHDGLYPRLNRAYPLGQNLWLMSMLHEHGQSVEYITPPLPEVYVLLPGGSDIISLELNHELITDALMRVARDEEALELECAPETMFAAGDASTCSIHVRYANGAIDTWNFPAGTQIKVPVYGCEVAKGRVIAHVVPRQGWRGLQSMTPEAKQAARADIIDRYTCHDVLGQSGYDLRLLQGPLPLGTTAYIDNRSKCEFLFDSSPIRLLGRVGMIQYNFLSNWYDRRLPVRRVISGSRNHRPLTSPLMGVA